MAKDKKVNFYLPEDQITLKVVFDNLRNYAIVGGVVALGQWIDRGVFNMPAGVLKSINVPHPKCVVWIFFALGAALLIANAMQTFFIIGKLLTGNENDEDVQSPKPVKPKVSGWRRIWFYVEWVPAVVIVILMMFLIVGFAFYLVLFSAFGVR